MENVAGEQDLAPYKSSYSFKTSDCHKMSGSCTHVTIVITSRYLFVSQSPLLSFWYFSL